MFASANVTTGQFRLTVEPTVTFPELLPQIAEKLPKSVDLQSITVSNRPQGGDARKIASLQGVSLTQVGLAYVALPISWPLLILR